jgi:hypothetical protein
MKLDAENRGKNGGNAEIKGKKLKSRGKMINPPDWQNPKVKPYFHQISLERLEEIAAYIEDNDIEEMG